MQLKAMSVFVISAMVAGCATTETMSVEDRREAVIETVMADEEQQQVAVSDADYDPNEIICKSIKRTSSRLAKGKDCRTAKEWRDSQSAATREMNRTKDRFSDPGPKLE
ncbi:hypothetical protein [Hyphococcus sp.]|uniref:hypothetical protein n=1 Tax=Hyphococcus sp. TaxID=2038636 RepID=UPI00208CBCEB|nr:MAG: hypothetical protein DHS20C04_30070 [Marinicaulis sp.]